jgi:hypothetical protein
MYLKLVGLITGEPHDYAGQYVVSYDADHHLPDGDYDGGRLVCTPDQAKATDFTAADAFRTLQSSPHCICHHLRADGQLNRPLTAFTAEIAEIQPLEDACEEDALHGNN